MKNYFVLSLLLACCIAYTSCRKKSSDECVFKDCSCADTLAVCDTSHYSPFDKGYTVVAYQYREWSHTTDAKGTGLEEGNRFDTTNILRADTLSTAQIKQLEKICMNRTETCNDYTCVNGNDCAYDPHHCIVFFAGNEPVAYLETCFICEDNRAWPSDDFGTRCGDFTDDLRYFYISLGFPKDDVHPEHAPGYVPDSVEIWKGRYQ